MLQAQTRTKTQPQLAQLWRLSLPVAYVMLLHYSTLLYRLYTVYNNVHGVREQQLHAVAATDRRNRYNNDCATVSSTIHPTATELSSIAVLISG